MRRYILSIVVVLSVAYATAQETVPTWINSVKLSGYGMTQYQYSSQEGNESNSFSLRMLRLSLEGRVMKDFYWKTQIQFNGNTSTLGNSPRVVDMFAEWQKYKFAKIKIGQFKRPFTFENPMNPIDQGFMSYAQNVTKLAGFSDRAGGHASNGRDIGIQLQGDFLKNTSGREIVHYQVGVYNGQGINVKDVDQRKDVIGGVWVMPVKGLRIGVFGWEGSYARQHSWTESNVKKSEVVSLPQHRYAISGEYLTNDWTLRTEYIHSTGYAFKTALVNTNDATATDVTISGNGNKADGYYALVIAPVIKKRLHVKARYDMYRPTGEWGKSRTQYEIGADYEFHHNFQIGAEFARINDRTLAKHNYNMVDIEVDYRF